MHEKHWEGLWKNYNNHINNYKISSKLCLVIQTFLLLAFGVIDFEWKNTKNQVQIYIIFSNDENVY